MNAAAANVILDTLESMAFEMVIEDWNVQFRNAVCKRVPNIADLEEKMDTSVVVAYVKEGMDPIEAARAYLKGKLYWSDDADNEVLTDWEDLVSFHFLRRTCLGSAVVKLAPQLAGADYKPYIAEYEKMYKSNRPISECAEEYVQRFGD